MKGSDFFKQTKKGTCERLQYFQRFLGLQIAYAVSAIMNLKIVSTIFVLMNWNSRRKMKILAKPDFFNLFKSEKSMAGNLPLKCLTK